MESGSLLGARESFFAGNVPAARFLLLQWVAPHAGTCVCVYPHKNLEGSMLGKD